METERYESTSVITVPQWEGHIALGMKTDEGEGTRPILLLLAVLTDRFVFDTASRSKDENTEPRSLGVDVFSLFSTEIFRGILRPAYSAGVLWDIWPCRSAVSCMYQVALQQWFLPMEELAFRA